MPIIDVLKWDAPPNVFAFKYPGCRIHNKSQLIVSPSQEAVLVKEGAFIGPFGPGRHVLDTRNYPVLSEITSILVSGGMTPFTAEVWFTNLAIPLNIKWGTATPIQIEDPKYHIILPIRSYGQYGIQVSDSMLFLEKLVGSMPAFTEYTLSEYFRGIILTKVANGLSSYLIDQSITVLRISSRLNEISAFLKDALSKDFEEYGLKTVSFTVNSISTDDSDPAVAKLRQALAKKAEMDIVGYNYQQERSFDVMDSAAGNPGGGSALMGAGIGMGVGMGLAVPMGNAASSISQNMRIPPMSLESGRKCPNCGESVAEGLKFCGNCGKPLKTLCPKCGHEVVDGVKFCPECGHSLLLSCPKCRTQVRQGTKFCPECGERIGG